jgi:hypothetical protein
MSYDIPEKEKSFLIAFHDQMGQQLIAMFFLPANAWHKLRST